MNTFSVQVSNLESILPQLPGYPFSEANRVSGGKNSQVYRLRNDADEQYALKLYFRHHLDRRNRLETEFTSLQLFEENGIKSVPKAFLRNQEQGWALYEYIEGDAIDSSEIRESDINALVQFLINLKNLKKLPQCQHLSPASEACFSVSAIANNLEQRLYRLTSLEEKKGQYEELECFLTKDFIPFLEQLIEWSKSRLQQSNTSFEKEINAVKRTLSPSDFGFHNALRCNDGKLVFLDFEYFGWDDPAKMISDFLLHPARILDYSLKQQFFEQIQLGFEDHKDLTKRVEIVYPLFGLKWCLIFLNEFIPEHLLRRGFADVNPMDKSKRQAEQLAKSKQMLNKIASEYEQFPYYR
ncbi:aminoglycoside phosphotransferase family protein [Lusitaniella coriacea LEGE 07157]|uniref:Aminoglycoside phosphotransferase family protein n=1 Tax=Lusitaniella coriacea LEGE 07157 TaxID=945747 RepID=A0A8J7IUY8_9CYAN|nr:phosphotransferase [Lusitaniella coriacea]MBE9116878.1 aminoglycoside phosphotransferase family protein [Lusitaniella coriacea LEGE 07157]